jgi:hypothetical protein
MLFNSHEHTQRLGTGFRPIDRALIPSISYFFNINAAPSTLLILDGHGIRLLYSL